MSPLASDLSYPPEAQRWPPEFPPTCAAAWGDDQYGLWIDVVIGGPSQRLRWIEPGEFVMGSPEGEAGRFDNEGPQHVVRFAEGFWLAETACSQALWVAVMDANPSQFHDNPQNPVEQVSWDDVDGFLRQVEGLLPEMKAALPTEAEWEYACRAGTATAFSCGEGVTPEHANYDARISYAFGPTAEWRRHSVPVKSFAPNAWGLYQMHGNVWEWCADGPRTYDGSLKVNPCGDTSDEAEAPRVVRGGSWFNDPHWLRAAYRNRWLRDWSDGNLGFRFLLKSPRQGAEGLPAALPTQDA
ncbi:formylglycine-generating enzyme family protein [Zoogloea sp.]|uniref:formylglycine-generating enzyme family protein n=1 Tax=Zoogloea sp. TaxID=49181 RepID=UPI00261D8723|nr:formylglycine-generating enzyme family protein [uncultured Zoogloea sp.]